MVMHMKSRSSDTDGAPGRALTGRGEMDERIRALDWSRTPIGPREQWPASLRTVVAVLTATQFPMALLWGRELILIYNDAYRVICGDKHPAALGRSTRDIWSEVWPINQPILAAVMDRGETLSFEDKLFPINRRGHIEDAYFTLCYSPVRMEDGRIGGVLVVLEETTERKKAEEALRRANEALEQRVAERTAAMRSSEERYRRVFANDMVAMAVWNKAGSIVDANNAFLNLIGYTRAELEEGKIRWNEITPPACHEHDLQAVREVEEKGFCAAYEEAYRHKDGHTVPVLIGAGRFDEHAGTGVLFAIDITARKQVEAALIESEERFCLFMDNSPAIAWIKDERGRYVYLSRTYEDRFGVLLEDWRGKTDADLWPAEIAETFRRSDRAVLDARRAIEVEEETINPDGSRCYWLNSKFPFSDADGHRYVGGIGIDVTARKRAESVFHQAQKMETVGRLAGGVAHEFNNLLQGIVGYTELSRTHVAPDHPIGAYLNTINDAAIHAATLTRRLLAFAQRQMISPAPFNLNDHISAFLTLLRGLIGERIELNWMPGMAGSTVRMDPSQIDQILANLAANSRDAMAGGGAITITTANTTLDEAYCRTHAAAVPGDYVLLTFSDTGCGMDATTLDRLFEPFFTTKDIGKGMGMGLAVVYGIVMQNNGHITVESRQGKGTTFHIYLPRCAGDGTAAVTSRAEPARSPRGSPVDGVTVLLVDDDPMILKTGHALLSALGYNVLSAASAEEALRVEEGNSGTIHLLLTDVVMPGLDGRELATRLTAKRPGVKCIFMSGYPANHVARHGILERDVEFLAKPFTMDQLADKVREALSQGSANAKIRNDDRSEF